MILEKNALIFIAIIFLIYGLMKMLGGLLIRIWPPAKKAIKEIKDRNVNIR
jgi:hypothetical protein